MGEEREEVVSSWWHEGHKKVEVGWHGGVVFCLLNVASQTRSSSDFQRQTLGGAIVSP